jgi:DNA-binding GntR family transcriptional regulator
MTLAQLAKEVDAQRDTVMQAIGWLAREGKVEIEDNGRKRVISLR